jgi:hypothetical protein
MISKVLLCSLFPILVFAKTAAKTETCYGLRQTVDISLNPYKRKSHATDTLCIRTKQPIKLSGWTDVKISFSMEKGKSVEYTGMIEVKSIKDGSLTVINEDENPPNMKTELSVVAGRVILTGIEVVDAQSEKKRWVGLYVRGENR